MRAKGVHLLMLVVAMLFITVPAAAQGAPAAPDETGVVPEEAGPTDPAEGEAAEPGGEAGEEAAESDDLTTADEAYEIKMKNLEEKVNQLKENIFRSKARLMLLQETILHGVIAGSKAVIIHKNDMGGAYNLESVAYYLDGAPIFGRIDIDGSLSSDEEIEIYNGTIEPGNHLLAAYVVYRGSSPLFVYVEGIQVKLKASHAFKAEEGKITKIDVIGHDEGGVTARFDRRPAVKFETRFFDLQEEDFEEGEGVAADETQ